MRKFKHILKTAAAIGTALGATLLPASGVLAAPAVVATIKPVHSLVAAVMEGVGEPQLLIEGGQSPHTFSMRPSDASALENAELVVWIGPDLELFLEQPLASLTDGDSDLALQNIEGLTLFEPREGGNFEAHDHAHGDAAADDHNGHDHDNEHDHADHNDEEHAHENDRAHEGEHAHDEHDHEEPAHEDGHSHDDEHTHAKDHAHDEEHAQKDAHEHEHEGERGHDDDGHLDHNHGHEHTHGTVDAHVWLDPKNAQLMLDAIEERLAGIDPANAQTYAKNADAARTRLEDLRAAVNEQLAPVRDVPFVVFHDAYRYYEERFDIPAIGSIVVSPELPAGAARVAEVRERVIELGAACVFAEPQFRPDLIDTIIDGTEAEAGVLDPIGSDIPAGPEHYGQLIANLTTQLAGCLSS